MNSEHLHRSKPSLVTGVTLAVLLALGACSDNDSTSTHNTTSANTLPVANAGVDQAVSLNAAVALDGSGSSDADGDTLSYSWSLTGAPVGSSSALASTNNSSTSVTPDIAGTYTLTLTVNDGAGGTATDQVIIVATGAGEPTATPTAEPTATPTATPIPEPTPTPVGTATGASSGEAINLDNFISGALIGDVTTESCTLGNGTEASCYKITIAGVPAGTDVGPFCPRTTSDTAADAGIWLDGSGEVYNVDGNFILNLPTLYADDRWQLYDLNSGAVNVTTTQEACEAAARPDVAEEYQNHCVECSLDYVDGGVSQTFLIPKTPVPAATAGTAGRVGISLNGVILEASAPVDAILGAYTIAAFDDCGGHVNPVDGYHYHAATGCTETGTQSDGHAPLMGYALDGYGIYGRLDSDGNEHATLDECRGATDETRGYHYHAAAPGTNQFIGCFHGEVEASNVSTGGPGGGGPGAGGPPR